MKRIFSSASPSRTQFAKSGTAALVLVGSLGLAIIGCSDSSSGGGGGGSGPVSQTRNQLLTNVADNVVVPALTDFQAKSNTLSMTVALYASALRNSDPNTAQRLTEARQAWVAAMDSWQVLELLQFGPAGEATFVVGGEDRRIDIYAYAENSACRVDQELVRNGFNDLNFFQIALTASYGLDALEALLFIDGTDNDCSVTSAINQNGSWQTLATGGSLPQRRADYAERVATEVADNGQILFSKWDAAGDDFAASLGNAGGPGSPYNSAQQGINDVVTGLFYLEFTVKNRKLASPSGIGLPTGLDVKKVESRFANRSKENILINLRVFQEVFLGNKPNEVEGIGFDDLLTELGAGTLATQMTSDIQAAIDAVAAIPGTLADAVVNNPAAVQSAYDAVKLVTDNLQSQFISVLNLAVPQQGIGDND
ncbi:MAG: imelysin family protein [Planctomycetota bacterium]|nr:imelysin family protein [Planctomycetota bacterium]